MALSPADLERLLACLLENDSAVIRQATLQLKEPFRNPAIVPALTALVLSSQSQGVRQQASVLLRRRVLKHWKSLSPEQINNLKLSLLQVLFQEQQHLVVHSVAQVISEVADLEFSDGNDWPDLWNFIDQHCGSAEVPKQELGLQVLSAIADSCAVHLTEKFRVLMPLFPPCLAARTSHLIPHYALKTLSRLCELVAATHVDYFRGIIPPVLQALEFVASKDEALAADDLEFFDDLLETEPSVVNPHIKALVTFWLSIAQNNSLDDTLRAKVLVLVGQLSVTKKKKFLKQNFLAEIIPVIFNLLIVCPDEEEEEEEAEEDVQSLTPYAASGQVLDDFALNYPPARTLDPLMPLVQKALTSQDPNARRAAFYAIAVVTEGCSDFLKNRYLSGLLQAVYAGMADKVPAVQHASLYALGQFSMYFQPDISQYTAELMPALLKDLAACVQQEPPDKRRTLRTFYALEMFFERSEESMLQYMEPLMNQVMVILERSTATYLVELAVQTVGAVANTVEKHMDPYFHRIIEIIKRFLVAPSEDEKPSVLLLTALDTLGILGRTVSPEIFKPLANDCITLALGLLEKADDPDLRSVLFGLLASIGKACGDVLVEHLGAFVPKVLDTIKHVELTDTGAEATGDLSFQIDEDEDNLDNCVVANAYFELIEDACNSLGQIAVDVSVGFHPYLDDSFTEVLQVIEMPFKNIQKGGSQCISQLCISCFRALRTTNSSDYSQLNIYVGMTITKLVELISSTSHVLVADAGLQAMHHLLEELQTLALPSDQHFEKIYTVLRDILELKVPCLMGDDDEDDVSTLSGGQAEYEAMLVDSASDVLPVLIVARGPMQFAPLLNSLLPALLARTNEACTVAERSMSVGTLAEILSKMESAGEIYCAHLVDIFLKACQDEDSEVRNNAVFGVGLACRWGGAAVLPKFMVALQTLDVVLGIQGQERQVVDNVCSAVCRLICAAPDQLTLVPVLQTLLQHLPLEKDFMENDNVYGCLCQLIAAGHPAIVHHRNLLLPIFSKVVENATVYQVDDDLKGRMVASLALLQQITN